MKKKILSALLASAMVLSLAACGSTPASTGGSDAASGGDAAPLPAVKWWSIPPTPTPR